MEGHRTAYSNRQEILANTRRSGFRYINSENPSAHARRSYRFFYRPNLEKNAFCAPTASSCTNSHLSLDNCPVRELKCHMKIRDGLDYQGKILFRRQAQPNVRALCVRYTGSIALLSCSRTCATSEFNKYRHVGYHSSKSVDVTTYTMSSICRQNTFIIKCCLLIVLHPLLLLMFVPWLGAIIHTSLIRCA